MNDPLEQRLRTALNFLFQCLGDDLHSGQPSRDGAYLKSVMDGFYQIEFLGNAHASIRTLLQKFHDSYSPEVVVAPDEVMRRILQASQAEMVSEDEFLQLCTAMRIPPLAATVNFLTQLKEIVRLLPMKIYPTEAHRQRLLEAMQLAADAVIAVESSWR